MAPVKRIPIAELYEHVSKNPAENVIMEEVKPKGDKKWLASYMKNTFNAGQEKPVNAIIGCTDLLVVSPPADPNDQESLYVLFNKNNKNTDKPKTELQISISGNHSGRYVDLIRLFENERRTRIPQMIEKKTLSYGWNEQKQIKMIKERYSEHSKDRAGEHYKDPTDSEKDDVRIPLVLDFDVYPQTAKFNKGQPKTLIYDARTFRVVKDEKGIESHIEYDLAMVEGKPIDINNCHKFITAKSEIIECDISIDTTSKSNQGISTKQVVHRIVVNPKEQTYAASKPNNISLLHRLQQLSGRSDNAVSATPISNMAPATTSTVASTPATSTPPTTASTPATSAPSSTVTSAPATPTNQVSIDQLLQSIGQ